LLNLAQDASPGSGVSTYFGEANWPAEDILAYLDQLCQPRTLSPGKRAFKPARTLYLATTGFSPGETNTTTLTFGRMRQSGLERETGAVCMVIGVSVDGIGCPRPGLKALARFTSLSVHAGLKTRFPGLKVRGRRGFSRAATREQMRALAPEVRLSFPEGYGLLPYIHKNKTRGFKRVPRLRRSGS
jgi:hypothetical protein